jgi:hypothetical protein
MRFRGWFITDKTEQDEKKSEPTIMTMDYQEFQLVADAFIERSSQGFDEMPASVFFVLLFEHLANDSMETGELDSDI